MTIALIVVGVILALGAICLTGAFFGWAPKSRLLQGLLGVGFFGSLIIAFLVAAWLWLALIAWFSEPGGILP